MNDTTTEPLDRYAKTAADLLTLVGGPQNIVSLTHCVTRLRFSVRRQDHVDEDAIVEHPAVLGTLHRETFQIVVGPAVVARLHHALINLMNNTEGPGQ